MKEKQNDEIPYNEFLTRCKNLSTPDTVSLLNRKIRYCRIVLHKEQKRLNDMLRLKQYLKDLEK